MKSLIKILSNSAVYFFVTITWILLLYCNHKFLVINFMIAPFAAGMIWWLNWEYYSSQFKKLPEKFGWMTWVLMFIFDMVSWPLALIQTSKIVLVEENGGENV
jgi:hypothetical protein